MTDSQQLEGDGRHWSILGAEVPPELSGRRVLHIGDDLDGSLADLGDRGAEVARWKRPGGPQDAHAPFDLVYCAGALQLDPHPMQLLSDIWHSTRTGSTLLLESQIEPQPELSRYGRFVVDSDAGRSYWLPGRLTFRWLVEVSGFDVDRWLADPTPTPEHSTASAYLRATRAERMPALDLAIPGGESGARN